MGPSVHLECADFCSLEPAKADIVVANLTGDLLRRAAADVVRHLSAGGDLILSGVLADEQSAVVAAFESAGAKLQAVVAEDEWVGLRLRLPAEPVTDLPR
jgi:ribosomal protein L11 methyltransferase